MNNYGPQFIEPGAVAPEAAPTKQPEPVKRREARATFVGEDGIRRKVTAYGPDQATANARLAARLAELEQSPETR